MNGASQSVRLPAEFRFTGDTVFVTRDPHTGDVLLSSRSGASAWKDFFDFARSIDEDSDFMKERPLNRQACFAGGR